MSGNGWKSAVVGDLCTFSSGYGFGRADWAKTGLPIIRIQHLNGSSNFDYFAGTPDPEWIVQPGELLFAWAGTQGVSFGPKLWAGPRGVLNQHIYRVRPRPGVDPAWLHFLLQVVTIEIERKAHGFKSTLVHVRKADIVGRPCRVPPVNEQRAIAKIINLWGHAVTQTRRLLKLKRSVRDGLMQQLLTGRRRYSEFLGQAWPEVTLGSLLSESRVPGSHGASARKLTVKLYGKGVVPKQDERPGSAATRYFRRSAGQFIYSKLDFLNGAFGIVPVELDGWETTLDVPAFDISDDVNPRWLFYLVSSESFYRRQLGVANGGRKARRVNPRDFLRMTVPLPPLGEQKKIAAVLSLADREIGQMEQHVAALRDQKKGLMQQLVIGQVRLPQFREEEVAS